MNVAVVIAAVCLAAGAICALIRAERGPTMLDRTIALDVFATILIGAIIVEAIFSKRQDVFPILVILSLVGFVGSVTISRFASVEPEGEKRILSRAEIALEDARRAAQQEAELSGLVVLDEDYSSIEIEPKQEGEK